LAPVSQTTLAPSFLMNLYSKPVRGAINIPPSTGFEYKFIKKDGANVVWETGANRAYTTPASPCAVTLPGTAFRL